MIKIQDIECLIYLNVSTNIEPKTYKINNEGKLEIEWSEGNHTSYYDQEWLRKNCYTINNKKNMFLLINYGIILYKKI